MEIYFTYVFFLKTYDMLSEFIYNDCFAILPKYFFLPLEDSITVIPT